MNYQDDMKYMQSVKLAKQNDIIINTILAGNDQKTAQIWREIAQNANGAFSQIAQDGNVTVVATPYDKQIQQLNIELNNTVILYGNKRTQAAASRKMESISLAKPSASSDMAAYNSKRKISSKVFSGAGDLIQELEINPKLISRLKNDELPTLMKSMNEQQRLDYIAKMKQKRTTIQTKIDKLALQRAKYKADKIKKLSAESKDSFDDNLMIMIKEQAETKNIKY